jgi:hypothetical protein
MSLTGLLSAALPDAASMKRLSGKQRSAGAKTKEEAMFAVLLALADGTDTGMAALPAETQKKILASPTASRELRRIGMASSGSRTWMHLRSVLERFPPSVLIQILQDEMSAAQMRALGGKARCEGATNKDELVFAVMLALAERGSKALRDIPAAAQSRIQSAPSALDWIKMVERANADVLKEHGDWRAFRELLCTPREGLDDEEEDGSSATDDDAGADEDDAAARVAELESELAKAKAALSTATKSKTRETRAACEGEGASQTKRRLDFRDTAPRAEGLRPASTKAPAQPARPAGTPSVFPLWVSVLQALATIAVPLVIVMLVGSPSLGGMLPGQPGDDMRLHRLAK